MKFLIREGVIGANCAEVVQAPKVGSRLPSVLDVDQMKRLIEIPQEDALAVRDRAIMELFYSSALRLSELTRLNCQDVDFKDKVVRVRGKGNVDRIVPVGSFAIGALQRWLRVRSPVAKTESKPCSLAALGDGSGGERSIGVSTTGQSGRGLKFTCIRTCFDMPAPLTYSSRVARFARSKSYWAM